VSNPERLQTENDELRQQLEDYRQRELAELRQRLAEARVDVAHYRSEAERNAALGRQINAEAQVVITKLRGQLQAKEQLANARPKTTR